MCISGYLGLASASAMGATTAMGHMGQPTNYRRSRGYEVVGDGWWAVVDFFGVWGEEPES